MSQAQQQQLAEALRQIDRDFIFRMKQQAELKQANESDGRQFSKKQNGINSIFHRKNTNG